MSIAAVIGIIVASAVVAALAVALIRAAAAPRAAPAGEPLADAELEEAAGVEDALSAAIKRATVSYYDETAEDGSTFAAFKKDLELLFPRVHAAMSREEFGERSLLYTWKGSDPSLKPAILCAHFDVVPADDAAQWKHPPFSGDIAEGAVWGRGAQDIKLMLISSLHASERLLERGFAPKRTIYFAFGGDEEIGGSRGAKRIGEELASRGVDAAFLLDEGGPVAEGMLSFADRPLAMIGIAEKGFMDVAVEALGSGGHASMPPRRTAVGDLSRAVAAVEASPSRSRICYTLSNFLKDVSPYAPFGMRLLFRNLWLFGPAVRAAFSATGTTNAMVRTTYAPTMLSGSAKENVLADAARANVNIRILPGETSAQTLARIQRIVGARGATARMAHPEAVVEPLPESPVDGEGYDAIVDALGRAFPDAAAVPFLMSAGTDTKHYCSVTKAMYRLTPVKQSQEQLARVHGRDERVEIPNLRRCEIFYARLIERL